jgi:hypothetical protein
VVEVEVADAAGVLGDEEAAAVDVALGDVLGAVGDNR